MMPSPAGNAGEILKLYGNTPFVAVTGVKFAAVPSVSVSDAIALIAVSGVTYWNWSDPLVALVPCAVVTVTSTVLTLVDVGDMAVIAVALATVKLVAGVLPKRTLVAPVKFVPVIVTAVPPAAGPLAGNTEVTVGNNDATVRSA